MEMPLGGKDSAELGGNAEVDGGWADGNLANVWRITV
jgi:hypothetical protein